MASVEKAYRIGDAGDYVYVVRCENPACVLCNEGDQPMHVYQFGAQPPMQDPGDPQKDIAPTYSTEDEYIDHHLDFLIAAAEHIDVDTTPKPLQAKGKSIPLGKIERRT
jgi:hypothetical protein